MAPLVRHIRKFLRPYPSSFFRTHLIIFHPTNCSSSGATLSSLNSQAFYQTPSLQARSHIYVRFYTLRSCALKPSCLVDLNCLKNHRDQTTDAQVAKLVENVRNARDLPSEGEALAFLDGLGLLPEVNLVALAVWELRNSWESAMLVFRWGAKWDFNDERLLSLIVWVLGASGKFNIAWSLIRDAHRSSSTNIRLPMLIMMERYAAMNFPDKAIKTFEVMENLRLSPDQEALYTLLQALCENGNAAEAEEFLLQNKKLFPLETQGFNILLNAWCNISVDFMEAKRVWREMSRNCITPDEVSYTCMISCFSKAKNLFDSLRLYDEMKKRGWSPSLEVYNSLIYVLASEKCFDEACKVMGKIKEMGLRPDSATYNSLIGPLCAANRFGEARTVLNEMMREENINPTRETYHTFLQGSDFESTVTILNEMKQGGIGPNTDTFSLIFDHFFELGRPEDALKIWVEMKDYGVEPESTHYVKIMHNLIHCGYLPKARELCEEMSSKGLLVEPKLKKLLQEQTKGKGKRRRRIVQRVRKSTGVTLGRNTIRRRKRGGKGKSRKEVTETENR